MLNEAEIVETYRLTIQPLYRYVSRRVGGDTALAEDLVQETWMRALDTWPSRGMPDEPLAWLTRVAHNTLVSHFRRVQLGPDLDMRRGLLGKGAWMLVTSQATRTSPVARGKSFLERVKDFFGTGAGPA